MNGVIEYYDEHPINEGQIRAALAGEGKDAGRLLPEDLYAHDQDHYGGVDATRRLAEACGIQAGDTVLDICSGMGGPARLIAHEWDCDVTGIDFNPNRTPSAARLTAWVGLEDKARFVRGDATSLPFTDTSFDRAISQEAFLHIGDKAALFAECFRVLKPGGRLAFTDWIALDALGADERQSLAEGIAYRDVHPLADYCAIVAGAGFAPVEAEDVSDQWRTILRARLEMYRGMEGSTVASFGVERHRAFVAGYEQFIDRIEGRRIGGARIVATKSAS
ncbi:MAG: methyltransferase domain-containing protein [Alphaproteobacteria bacterium]|jgi:SAM-dependent methyltransferase|nr:methyltransferase domain-containing protein [Alphaproteobacteria bacterium]